MSGGLAAVTAPVTSPTTLCVRISGSAGEYSLRATFVGDPPDVTGVQNSSGVPISSSTVGSTVRVRGDGFVGPDVTVAFGGARARITYMTPTRIDAVIPTYAADGDVVVTTSSGPSEGFGFTVGVTTAAVATFTEGDPDFYEEVDGAGVYLNRALVEFGYDYDATEVAAVLNTVQALDSNRTGWAVVGVIPELNAAQVEWTFTAGPADADLESLLDDIDAQLGVISVQAEQGVDLYDLATPSDFDLYYDPVVPGALNQINFEEARRLYWLSGLTSVEGVEVLVPDTGLRFGSATWGAALQDEIPANKARLYERTSTGAWAETAAYGHHVWVGESNDHGTSVAGLISAASNRNPSWSDGGPRSAADASGIYSSFDMFDVDDDRDSATDEEGEWAAGMVSVFGTFGTNAERSTAEGSSVRVDEAFLQVNRHLTTSYPQVVSVSFGVPRPWGGWGESSWTDRLGDLCRQRPLILAAGNAAVDIANANWLASLVMEACPGRALVVSGVQAGSAAADAAHVGNYGSDVGLLAPMEGFFVATAAVDAVGTWSPTYDTFAGTSASAPAVASAYAIIRGIIPLDIMGDSGVLQILVDTADDVSALYSNPGAAVRLNLFEAVWEALRIAGTAPAMTMPTKVFVADYGEGNVVVEEVDAPTGAMLGGATVVDVTADGCDGPTDVEVHPLGDVFYVLCVTSGNIGAWTTDTLMFIGSVDLVGSVATYSEMAIGADGVLRVGSISSGVAVVESFDTWNGTRFLAAETLSTSATGRVFGVAVAPDDGNRFAFGVTDNAVAEDDDGLVVLTPDGLGRTASTLNVETFASASYPYTTRLRDVSWYASGDDVVGEFYGGTGYDMNLGLSDGASTAGTAEVDYCSAPLAIAMDRLNGSGAGWVACGSSVVGVGLTSHSCDTTPCNYTPTTYLYPGVSAITSPSYFPNFLDVAQNGAFLIFGAYDSAGTSNTSSVFSVPRSVATAAASFYTGSYDAVGSNFTKPRGAAITPMLSIATPRPGTQIAGIKRLHVIVRDPTVTEVYYSVDGTEVCSDTELADGSAEDCLLNTSAWASGEHVVTVTASGGANGEFEMGATYHAF